MFLALQEELRKLTLASRLICANIGHLIGRLNQPAADGFLPLRAFKPSSNPNNPVVILRFTILSSDSADRGRSIIRVSPHPAIVPIEGAVYSIQALM